MKMTVDLTLTYTPGCDECMAAVELTISQAVRDQTVTGVLAKATARCAHTLELGTGAGEPQNNGNGNGSAAAAAPTTTHPLPPKLPAQPELTGLGATARIETNRLSGFDQNIEYGPVL